MFGGRKTPSHTTGQSGRAVGRSCRPELTAAQAEAQRVAAEVEAAAVVGTKVPRPYERCPTPTVVGARYQFTVHRGVVLGALAVAAEPVVA